MTETYRGMHFLRQTCTKETTKLQVVLSYQFVVLISITVYCLLNIKTVIATVVALLQK